MFNWLKKTLLSPSESPRVAVEATAKNGSAIQPDLADASVAYKNNGDAYLNIGQFESAAESYRQAITLKPDYAEAYNNMGNALREQKRYDEAERCFKQAISIKPELANAYYNLGALLQEQGKTSEAINNLYKALELKPDAEIIYLDLCYALFKAEQYEAAKKITMTGLSLNPNNADFHSFLGNLYYHEKNIDRATACYQTALSIQPDSTDAAANLGKIFQKQDHLTEAIDCYRKVLKLKPDYTELYFELGVLLQKQRKPDEALAAFQKALALKPDFSEAHIYLGNILKEQGKLDEALACYQKALTLKPDFVEAHVNIGNILKDQGKPDEAMACYQRALKLKPDSAEAHLNLGIMFKNNGEFDHAIACYRRALELKPDFADAHNNLGNALFEQGLLNEALTCYHTAIELKPDYADAYYSSGAVLVVQRKDDAAIAYLRRALEIDPDHNTARTLLLHQLQHMCEWADLESNLQTIRKAVLNTPATGKNLFPPFAFLAIPGATAEEQKRCAERWSQSEFQPLVSLRNKLGFDFKRPPNKKIALAYISADLRNHPVAFLMSEVFELHDRSRFKIVAYAYDTDGTSPMRKRLESAFDDFVDIRNYSYEEAARKIYEDHIDILVDLTGHTQNNRFGILALRPAPIQVNYLGYPGTMGADFVDYLIADRFTIPPEKRQYYTEKIAWMPDCFQANDRTRPRPAPPSRTECGLPRDAVVFCCFNQTLKITPEMFGIWCRLLKAVPGSILWLPISTPHAEGNLRREAESRGIASEQLVMAPLLHREEHLARLQCADLFLDTLPFNAGTTCSDALWMGLPVITCAGDAFVSRMAGSLLTAIGAPEMITYNLEDYYTLALDLATDRNKLEAIRNKIIANRDITPLFDSARFTRNLEEAYLQMMKKMG